MTEQEAKSQDLEEITSEVVDLSQLDEAEIVDLKDSVASTITAAQVEMKDSATKSITAETVTMTQSAAGFVNADVLTVGEECAVGMARVRQAEIVNGKVGTMISGSIEAKDIETGMIVSRHIAGDKIHTSVLLAGNVEGSVETAVDTSQVLLFGLVMGIVTGLVMVAGRLLFGQRE
ncbi:MAG: hypothetical protein U9O54_07865 [Chloroflexota bacterium]|nr:hypothetical protein [Chloroflexota bacterium]